MPSDMANDAPYPGNQDCIAELLGWPLSLLANFLADLGQLF